MALRTRCSTVPANLKGAARCCQPRKALKLPLKAMAIPAQLHCRCGHAPKCTESAEELGSNRSWQTGLRSLNTFGRFWEHSQRPLAADERFGLKPAWNLQNVCRMSSSEQLIYQHSAQQHEFLLQYFTKRSLMPTHKHWQIWHILQNTLNYWFSPSRKQNM